MVHLYKDTYLKMDKKHLVDSQTGEIDNEGNASISKRSSKDNSLKADSIAKIIGQSRQSTKRKINLLKVMDCCFMDCIGPRRYYKRSELIEGLTLLKHRL